MFPPLLSDFLDYLHSIKGASFGTQKEYSYNILEALEFFAKRKTGENIEDISIDYYDADFHQSLELSDFHAYFGYLARDLNNKAVTRSRKASALRTYFSYLVDIIRVIDKNPTDGLESPRIESRHPVYLNLEETKRLLLKIDEIKNPFLRTRDYAIILLFITCGLRLSELSNIDILDIKEDRLNVIGKGNKERTVFLTPALINALNEYIAERPEVENEKALFLSTRKSRLSNRAIQQRVEKHLEKAGFDTSIYSTHKLRHTAATLMYQHGDVDIRALQEVLGHSSIATTEIYTHVNNKRIKDAIDSNPLADFK